MSGDESRGVILQYFHWYSPADGTLWTHLEQQATDLAAAGFSAIWLPPMYKGHGGTGDTGYGVYDLYDLGEFDQKGTVRTKYGTKDQLLGAIAAAHAAKLHIYADIVLNHRMGADATETVLATPYRRDDRSKPNGEPAEIESYSVFTFPGRKGTYSGFTWDHRHFDAVDHDARNPQDHDTIHVFVGKRFDDYVSGEFGNYDYLMGCDLDFDSEEVRRELTDWGRWFLDTTGVDGFRLDAVKHIPAWFFPPWLESMRSHARRDLFAVGEYWAYDTAALQSYIHETGGTLSLFDVVLHGNFHRAGKEGADFDLRTILDGSLVSADPAHAVTFVANHDSQALQALESVVEPWFKPLAYALVLLRTGGYPCVFAADYHGASYTDTGDDQNRHSITMPAFKELIDILISCRQIGTHGKQRDYFDHGNTIGWTFSGDGEHPHAMAVIMSNGDAGSKLMETGKPGTTFKDATGTIGTEVRTDAQGCGTFACEARSVSVWVSV